MKIKVIFKRCERCCKQFEIPNVKESPLRELMIQFYPCGHCGYIKDILYPKNNKSGRCLGCSIPFALINHQAKGFCNRCYMKELRHKVKSF